MVLHTELMETSNTAPCEDFIYYLMIKCTYEQSETFITKKATRTGRVAYFLTAVEVLH